MKTRPLWITRRMIEKAARALYRKAGWDRAWEEIMPEGRRRFREAALATIIAAIPNAVRKIGR